VIIPLRGDEVRRPGRKVRPPTVLNPTGSGPTTGQPVGSGALRWNKRNK